MNIGNTALLDVNYKKNDWSPPTVPELDMAYEMSEDVNAMQSCYYLHIFQIEPYIDSIFIEYGEYREIFDIRRFTIKEDYIWNGDDEDFFHEYCIKNERCCYCGGQIDKIYEVYSEKYPEWHIKRYLTHGLRLLDHIYNCMRKTTSKEILYKSGLDELAANIDELDELKLMSSKPSDIYGGVSIKILRSINCHDGTVLANKQVYRQFIKEINKKFPNTFKTKLNDAQCRYIKDLIDGKLTVGEAGRLFDSRKEALSKIWCHSLYEVFMEKEKQIIDVDIKCKKLADIDPLYEQYAKEIKYSPDDVILKQLIYYLLTKREDYNKAVRRAIRKDDYFWQERGDEYYVRCPQTINDFCREAIYMHSCLLSFVYALINGDTTILFLRNSDDVNVPFITMEIYDGELMQAYHRFNTDCTPQEADWIRGYCHRHGISTENFQFDSTADELF